MTMTDVPHNAEVLKIRIRQTLEAHDNGLISDVELARELAFLAGAAWNAFCKTVDTGVVINPTP